MRQQLTTDSVDRYIQASPDELYAIISDVTRTPELSPEVVKCTWIKGATGPAVGARFKAINHAGRGPDWPNWPVVITADPGREFAFSRTEASDVPTVRLRSSRENSSSTSAGSIATSPLNATLRTGRFATAPYPYQPPAARIAITPVAATAGMTRWRMTG